MSWLFSRALVGVCLPPNCSATEPCAQLSVMPTPHKFWHKDKTMEPSGLSRFGQTCAVLTEDRGAELLTAWLVGFHAKTSALPGLEKGLTASGLGFGASSRASFARLSQQSSEWKTAQCSLLEDSHEYLQILPRWGSMRNGMLYLRKTLVPTISVAACGSLLPTLTVCGNYNAKGASATSGDGLVTALKRMPTLTASNGLDGGSNSRRAAVNRGAPIPNGPLNPDWCEWFMGFPIGWSASVALEMPKFHEWQQQHSPR